MTTGLRKVMLRAHRQAWAWQDEYHGLSLADIRELERQTQEALKAKMAATAENSGPDNFMTESASSDALNVKQSSDSKDTASQSNVSIETLTSANADDNIVAANQRSESSHVSFHVNSIDQTHLSASPKVSSRTSLSSLGAKKRESWNSIRSNSRGTCTVYACTICVYLLFVTCNDW